MAKNKFIDYTNDQLENLINEIYAGSISASVLPVDLYHAINARLLDAVWRGFGGSSGDFVDGSADKLLVQYYEHNIAVFSGAKTFQQVKDMSNAVFKPDGYKRDFSDFKKLITGDGFHDGIFRTYNVNWLRTEYDTAFATAQMGRQWNEYVADAETFPLLKYVTVHDERVRHDHKAFDGVTLPIGHSFWNTHTPPNGFNCRCRLIQLSEFDEYTITDDGDVKNLPDPDQKLFEFNPGKDGYIFDESKHPYSVKVGERFKVAQSVNFGFPTPPKPVDPLPTPKLPETIIEVIQSNPEKPKFKPDNMDEIFDVETDPLFWSLLKKPTTVRRNFRGESYARGNSVDVDVNRFTTDYGMKKIIYHEFGHVIHDQCGWNAIGLFDNIVDPIVENYFTKWKTFFKPARVKAGEIRTPKFEHLSPYNVRQFKTELRHEFPEMNVKDFNEQFGAMFDTIASLTKGRLGAGHELSYWKQGRGYFDRAEFIAHAFENKFLGNELFKFEFPDLYNDTIKMIDELINKEKLK